MHSDDEARGNHLLAALAPADWQRWLPHLERVELAQGQVLHEMGEPPRHAYFPTTAVVCLLGITRSGHAAEIAVVGNEGLVGIALFMGGDSTPARAVVQSAGVAFRIKAQEIRVEFARAGPAMHLLLRYVQARLTQVGQTAVCNRLHSIEQQLSRWLLLSLDRAGGNELSMSHEFMANMLGVRRESVSEAARRLHDAGLISYTRGHIVMLDRAGLERRSCECYGVLRREFVRLLPEEVAT